jgi:molecular chaperone Hsp33
LRNQVAAFSIDGAPVRGRIVRLDAPLDAILRRHDYPRPVALLLGEAILAIALIGSMLKAKGRVVLQAEGDGVVRLLVAEYRDDGGLRGYARLREGAALGGNRISPRDLIGAGMMTLTLDQGDDFDVMQGVAPLEGATLSECLEGYFIQSEQTPTRFRIAIGEALAGDGASYQGGGVLIQKIAGDAARGATDEDWSRAELLFATTRDDELADLDLPADRLLYRLFHEDGVRLSPGASLEDRCTCDPERLGAVMRQFTAEEIQDLIEPDGFIHATCQFCARRYHLSPDAIGSR